MPVSKHIILLTAICPTFFFVSAQKEWKGWASAGLTLSFTRKLDLRLNHLRSYNLNNSVENGFNQTSASVNYDLTRKLSLLGGAMLTSFPSSLSESTKRVYARASYKIRLAKLLNWSNGMQAEYHSSAETRFRYRFIYITRLSNRKEIPFLRLTLSAAYWLYYNQGGNQIRYFDKTGLVVTRHSPDGLHRGRLYLAAGSKVARGLTVSLFYMQQNEFNLLSPEFRQMNVINPATGKITRPFDSYRVAGLNLLYDINLYPSHNKKSPQH
jgi:hypothetical protein